MTQTEQVTPKYPVGGPRQPVYDLMRGLGFSMSKWSDKYWNSLDGIDVQIFGTGSMARVSLAGTPDDRFECELDRLSERIDALRHDKSNLLWNRP